MANEKYELRVIDAVKNYGYAWTWNASHKIAEVELDTKQLEKSGISRSRYLLSMLRERDLIPTNRHGRFCVEEFGEHDFEVLHRTSMKPHYAFVKSD